MASWEFKEPPEFADVPLNSVAHNVWNSLSGGDKLKVLEGSLLS